MTLDDDMRQLAEQQHAVLSRRQARAFGATTSALHHRLTGPDWDAPTPRVLRLVGAPQTDLQRLMVATLDAEAAISHLSALYLWALPGFDLRRLHVSRSQSQRAVPSSIATLHRPRYLPPSHLTERRGIPVTTLPRTLFDLARLSIPGASSASLTPWSPGARRSSASFTPCSASSAVRAEAG